MASWDVVVVDPGALQDDADVRDNHHNWAACYDAVPSTAVLLAACAGRLGASPDACRGAVDDVVDSVPAFARRVPEGKDPSYADRQDRTRHTDRSCASGDAAAFEDAGDAGLADAARHCPKCTSTSAATFASTDERCE